MSTTTDGQSETGEKTKSGCGRCHINGMLHRDGGSRGRWTFFNTAAMVLGFILFWPVGLVVLFWIWSGRDVRTLPGAIRDAWYRFRQGGGMSQSQNENVVFNEYQQAQYDKIQEIKDEIQARRERFQAFRADASRRADKAEFDEFMATQPIRS